MKKIFVSLVLIILASVAYSQEEDQLLVSEIKQSTVITQPATLKKGFFRISAVFTYGAADKMFSDNGRKEYLVGNAWTRSSTNIIELQYGLSNSIEMAFALPYEISTTSRSIIDIIPVTDSVITTARKLKGNGIGDIEFAISYQIIKGTKSKPSLVSKLIATFPTGRKNPSNIKNRWEYDKPTGRGETTLALQVIYRKVIYPYSYSFTGAFKYPFGGEKVLFPYEDPISFRSGNYYEAGGNFNFLLNDWIAVQNDLYYAYKRADSYNDNTTYFSNNQSAIYYHPNISFQLKKFRLVQGVLFPLKGKSISADPYYNIYLQYIF